MTLESKIILHDGGTYNEYFEKLGEDSLEEIYGEKTAGLIHLGNEIKRLGINGIQIPPFLAIPVDFYRRFLDGKSYGKDQLPFSYSISDPLLDKELKQANFFLPGNVYAIRSSAIDEGPSGMNPTLFIYYNPAIENFLDRIKSTVRRIYGQYEQFSLGGKGIGILIQEVPGVNFTLGQFERFKAPLLSGVITSGENDDFVLRLTSGMGTKAVDMCSYSIVSAGNSSLDLAKFSYRLIDAINLTFKNDKVEEVRTT